MQGARRIECGSDIYKNSLEYSSARFQELIKKAEEQVSFCNIPAAERFLDLAKKEALLIQNICDQSKALKEIARVFFIYAAVTKAQEVLQQIPGEDYSDESAVYKLMGELDSESLAAKFVTQLERLKYTPAELEAYNNYWK